MNFIERLKGIYFIRIVYFALRYKSPVMIFGDKRIYEMSKKHWSICYE